MIQTQWEPKNAQKKIQKIQEIALDVLHKRSNMLLQAVKDMKSDVDLIKMEKCYEDIIADFCNHSPKISNFRLQILIAGTRSWEGFSTHKDGRRRFSIIDSKHSEKINAEFQFNYVIIQEKVEIIRIPNCHQVLKKVQQNLLLNSNLMEKILGTKQVKESIGKYFVETKFYTFRYVNFPKDYVEQCMKEVEKTKGKIFFNPNKLYGLSSYNGLKTFVNFQLFDDAADHFDFLENLPMMINKDQTKFEELQPIYKLLLTLEHESCHSIPRHSNKNTDPLLISPEKNDQLRIDDKFQEAGYYYAQMAYRITADVSPFCINANYKEEF